MTLFAGGGTMRKFLSLTFFALILPAAHAELVVSPLSVEFNNQKINGFSTMQNVWVQNFGQQAANLTVSNECYGDFEVNSDCYVALQPDMSCTITVQFQPHRAGYQSCNIMITDSTGDFENVSVGGTGVP
jgi:hypothetical protein